MTTKLNTSIFGNMFYLVGGHFRNNCMLFSKYNEKFILDDIDFSGEFSYKKTNIYTHNVKLHQIQSDIIIKNDLNRVWFIEKYVIKLDNNNIIEKHNIKTIWHAPNNTQYICNTEYKDLPKDLLSLLNINNSINNISLKDILSVRFSK